MRWTYNQCVKYVNEHGIKGTTIKVLREHCVTKDALRRRGASWANDIPFDIRDEGARDLLKALKAEFAKRRKQTARGETLTPFRMSMRRRKDGDTLTVHKKHWMHKRGEFASIFGKGKLHSTEPIPASLDFDSRMLRDNIGNFYLCLPGLVEKLASEKVSSTFRVAALDPGVRTFQTVFSSSFDGEDEVVEWGAGDMSAIFRMCLAADRLQSRISKSKRRNRHRKRRALLRHFARIRNRVNDIQRKLAKWLCSTHDLVIIPSFDTQNMVKKGSRRIHGNTARQMCTWAHYRFRQHLASKAREYPHCEIIVTSEAYTSKTCGSCGFLHKKLGASKTFNCPSCHVILDRDVNGARNVLLRCLSRKALADQVSAASVKKPRRKE